MNVSELASFYIRTIYREKSDITLVNQIKEYLTICLEIALPTAEYLELFWYEEY